LPEPFREIARNCLKRDPNARWTVPQIKARLAQARPVPAPAPEPSPVVAKAKPARNFTPGALGILVVLAIAMATILFRHKSAPTSSDASHMAAPKAEEMEEMPAKPSAAQPSSNPTARAASSGQGDVVREVQPKISPSAQRTIRGTIRLRVRAHVDPAGNVSRADLVSAGPSKYFARLVMEAAREWKFVPSSQPGERRYMMHFDLARRGNSAHAEASK
jgi:TonB family protein